MLSNELTKNCTTKIFCRKILSVLPMPAYKRLSASEAHEEAEDLAIVGIVVLDGKREVEGQRGRAQGWYIHPESETRRDTIIVPRDVQILRDGTIVDEEQASQHVIRCKRKEILDAAEDHRLTTDLQVARLGTRTAEREST